MQVAAAPIADIMFTKPKRGQEESQLCSENRMQKADEVALPSDKELDAFFDCLAECSTSVSLLSTVPKYSDRFVSIPAPEPNLPVVLSSLYNDQYRKLSESELTIKCQEIFDDLQISNSEAQFLEVATRNQSACLQWFNHRVGRITASNVYAVLHTSIKNPSPSLLKQICSTSYNSKATSAAIEWGRKNESTARDEYILQQQLFHQGFVCSPAGLVVHPSYPHLGASPDGWIQCDCCGKGVLEIKCPYKHHFTAVHDINNPDFCLIGAPDNLQLKTEHKYYYQVQQQMALCDVDYCDFVVWTINGGVTLRMLRDEDFLENIMPTLNSFFVTCILPELLTRRIQIPIEDDAETSRVYCYCHQGEDGREMIGCDNTSCKFEWFHFDCVGLSKKPKSKYWYCPDCRKQ